MKSQLLYRSIAFCIACCMLLLMIPITVNADTDDTETFPDGIAYMDSIISDYGYTSAVMIYSPDEGMLYSWNNTVPFSGASLIKLPYAYFVCSQIDAGEHSLNESMTYTSSWYHSGAGVIRRNGSGVSYTVRQLLEYMMKYSDNVAYDMLVHLFGVDGFNEMVEDWGYSVEIGKYSRFPELTADFMRTSMTQVYQHRNDSKAWKIVWNGLCESVTSLARDADDKITAVKYGSVYDIWHEACFVEGLLPYVLIIMTETSNDIPNTKFFQNVTKAASQIVLEYRRSKVTLQKLKTAYADAYHINDFNQDGVVNLLDVIAINVALCHKTILTEDQNLAADVDHNGILDFSDSLSLLQSIII